MTFDRPIVLGRARASRAGAGAGRARSGAAPARAAPGPRHRNTAFFRALPIASSTRRCPKLLRRGGFTGDLGVALRARRDRHGPCICGKTCRSPRIPITQIARYARRAANARDLLLVKRAWLAGPRSRRNCACCLRRRAGAPIYPASLQWALPGKPPPHLLRARARGDCEARLEQLTSGRRRPRWIVAKANIDRLLESNEEQFSDVRRGGWRAVLETCEVMVLPLAPESHRAGAGAPWPSEIRRERSDLGRVVSAYQWIRQLTAASSPRRARLAPTGDEDHPLGVSIVPVHCGEIEFTRGQRSGQWIQSAELRRQRHAVATRPPGERAVWTGEAGQRRSFIAASRCRCGTTSFAELARGVVSSPRSEAWPDGYSARPGQLVWRRRHRYLAPARGARHLGSRQRREPRRRAPIGASARFFPRAVQRWVKFFPTNTATTRRSANEIATYRLERCAPLADLSGHTHFYWRSGAQFYDYLQANPEIRGAWHGCGPGNTFSMIRAAIGEDRVRRLPDGGRIFARKWSNEKTAEIARHRGRCATWCRRSVFGQSQLIQPLFLVDGLSKEEPLNGLPRNSRHTLTSLLTQFEKDLAAGRAPVFCSSPWPAQKIQPQLRRGFCRHCAVADAPACRYRCRHLGRHLPVQFHRERSLPRARTRRGKTGSRRHPQRARVVRRELRQGRARTAISPSDMNDGRVAHLRAGRSMAQGSTSRRS